MLFAAPNPLPKMSEMTETRQKQVAAGGGTLLLVLGVGAALLLSGNVPFKKLDATSALLKAQAFVKDPAWREVSFVNRPFSEYHAWEVQAGPEGGTFIVTARHYLTGPTKFVVTSESVKMLPRGS